MGEGDTILPCPGLLSAAAGETAHLLLFIYNLVCFKAVISEGEKREQDPPRGALPHPQPQAKRQKLPGSARRLITS